MRSHPHYRSIQKGAHAVYAILILLLIAVGSGLVTGDCTAADLKQASSKGEETSLVEGYGLSGDNPRFRVSYFIKEYGRADKEDPRVARAQQVFETIAAVADKRIQRLPQLAIVGGTEEPLAICLSDGHIVISKKSIDLCYDGVPQQVGDARFAFVLGHELGHLADDDFWHLATYAALTGDPQCKGLMEILEKSKAVSGKDENREGFLAVVRSREMRADDRGFLYAAVAGYLVDALMGDNKESQDFFDFWVQQTAHSRIDPEHPSPAERAQLLHARLKELLSKVDFYKFGVRLAHFERYEDAVYFLQEFQKSFPSREVFSNLGYCHLRMATQRMEPSYAYQYWLPSVLDVQTQVESLRLMGPGDSKTPSLTPAAKEQLKKAVSYLVQACEMDEAYLPSRINLAAAYFYLGEEAIFKARASIEEARKIAPRDPEVLMLRALIINREGQGVDTWLETVKILEELAARPGSPPSVRYNLAVLSEERGRTGIAVELWKTLAEHPTDLPSPLRRIVAEKTNMNFDSLSEKPGHEKLPWDIPVSVGDDLLEGNEARAKLKGLEATSFNWGDVKLTGKIYKEPGRFQILEMDDKLDRIGNVEIVEMVVLTGDKLGSPDALQNVCSTPIGRQSVWGGTLLTCGSFWSALVRDVQVKEVWVARK